MAEEVRANQILKKYANLQEIMLDKDLAKLGDAYVNFVYSLGLSLRLQRPAGAKVNNQILARAIKNAGLREMLPRRMDRHVQGNAAEALIAYAWLRKFLSLEDCLKFLGEDENPEEAFAKLLEEIGKRLSAFHV
jgi:hypothetical protein